MLENMNKFYFLFYEEIFSERPFKRQPDPKEEKLLGMLIGDQNRDQRDEAYCNLQMYFMVQASHPFHELFSSLNKN